jgi:hypothetical protein
MILIDAATCLWRPAAFSYPRLANKRFDESSDKGKASQEVLLSDIRIASVCEHARVNAEAERKRGSYCAYDGLNALRIAVTPSTFDE